MEIDVQRWRLSLSKDQVSSATAHLRHLQIINLESMGLWHSARPFGNRE